MSHSWGMTDLPISLEGRRGRLVPPFWPDFLGVAVRLHRARARYQRSPLAAIARLKFGRILGTLKGQGMAELRHNGVLRSSRITPPRNVCRNAQETVVL